MLLALATLLVHDYDDAIEFFTDALGFELAEDTALPGSDGPVKRWVVVRPPDSPSGILLARAEGDDQARAVGRQFAGRVGFFLHVEDFDESFRRFLTKGVEFVSTPREEAYGKVAVFLDPAGNLWDLLGPPPSPHPQGFPNNWRDQSAGRTDPIAAV